MSFSHLVEEMCLALEDEVAEIRRSGAGRRVPLSGGKLLGRTGDQFAYLFSSENSVTVPDDSPAQIELSRGRQTASQTYPCQVLSSAGFEVAICCPEPLPQELTYATLLLDASFLLEKLAEQLALLRADDCQLAMKLFGLLPASGPESEVPGPESRVRNPESDLKSTESSVHTGDGAPDSSPRTPDPGPVNAFQAEAIRAAVAREVTYVWGPPGTGKTTTLAHIARALLDRGLRVLVTAATNVAVDNAILKIADLTGVNGSVVRFGAPQLADVRQQPMLQLDGVALAMSGDLEAERLRLQQERHEMLAPAASVEQDSADGNQLSLFWQIPGAARSPMRRRPSQPASLQHASEEQLKRIEEAERALERKLDLMRERALRQARLIGATLSRTFLAANLSSQHFDAVLIDEASAAPLPAVFFAASLARGKAVALGDPKQLPPIALASSPLAQRWLRRDLFDEIRLGDDDDRAVLLREQYRMHPDIARLANALVYAGRLINARTGFGASKPALRLADTSDRDGECERPGTGSRLNAVHAQLAVELAIECLDEAPPADSEDRQVAIITPYAAQAKLIWRLLREEGVSHLIDVGTVHRFQGLERATIVFDTVEAPPLRPAPFVSGGYGSEAMRLINVAITRARSRLIVIANTKHLRRTLNRRSTLLGLLELLPQE